MNFKKVLSTVLSASLIASAVFTGTVSASESPLPFDDVPDTWYTVAVETVFDEGIMTGKSDSKFDPTAKITRAEVVTAFSRIACININGYGDALTFTDTASGQWYSDSVGWAAENGIVKGRGDGRFSPADNITRAELASVLVNFVNYMSIELPKNSKTDKFVDDATFAEWMKDPIDIVRKTGLMQGSDGKFNPLGNATRAEIAQVVKNLLPYTERMTVVKDGKSDYVIVASDEFTSAAERLQYQIEFTTGAKLDITEKSSSEKVIVLGNTDISTDGLGENGFTVNFKGKKVLIDGETPEGVYRGAVRFALSSVSGDDVRFTPMTAESKVSEYPVKSLEINGNDISKYTVFYPANASENTETGAKDIVNYIEMACGTKIGISTKSPSGFSIIVEEKTVDVEGQLDNIDNFSINSEGNNIRITGSAERGAMYGCYDFLEEAVGVRYLYLNIDYIIPSEYINITDLDYSETPGFIYRYPYMYPGTYPDMINKCRLAMPPWTGLQAHTFDRLDEDFSSQAENQPCLTSEEVYQTILKNAMALIASDPDCKLISISQNDNYNYCKCENCQASDAKYAKDDKDGSGGPAGTLIAFINRITAEINETYPDVIVHTFAYAHTKEAPENITVNDNVLVQLCTDYTCRSHRYYDSCHMNSGFTRAIKEWSEINDKLYIWDYGNWSCNVTTDLSYEVIANNFSEFYNHGAIGVLIQGGHAVERGHFEALRYYLYCKLCWNPTMSEEEFNRHMKEFLEGFYGEYAAKYVQDAIDNINSAPVGCYVEEDESLLAITLRNHTPISQQIMDKAELYTESSLHFDRVDCSQMQFDKVYLDFEFPIAYKSTDTLRKQAAIDASVALQAKYVKYGMCGAGEYTIADIKEFDRPPYLWADIVWELQYGKTD